MAGHGVARLVAQSAGRFYIRRDMVTWTKETHQSFKLSTAFEVVSWKAPLPDGVCCKQRFHHSATSLISKEESLICLALTQPVGLIP
jgi:hypothetical protein